MKSDIPYSQSVHALGWLWAGQRPAHLHLAKDLEGLIDDVALSKNEVKMWTCGPAFFWYD